MKKIISTWISCCLLLTCLAQSKQTGFKLGVQIMPTFSKVTTTSGSSAFVPGSSVTFGQVADSVQKVDKMDFAPGGGFSFMYNLKKNVELQTGLYYYQTGFERHVTDIRFAKPIYPGGPLIMDNTYGKEAYFHYRFKYLQLPLLINVGIPLKNINFQYNLYGTAGVGVNYLLDSDIRAVLEGFTIDNKSKLKFDSTGYNLNKVTLHATIGARFEYLMQNRIILSVQPLYNLNLVQTTTSTPLNTRTGSLTLMVGLNYRFQRIEEIKKGE